ncbi:hypothetical protein MBAV_002267 [Candidatus Magnetobacterium bavaricum]|uniref:Uncharacterized protein n=1 Tax=Candidatus Magnetobacterium bavaricum TaxID=29290 RepID=A0A0F3GXV9_9BACT|nr:hypothetical protein MBAV_002267 [Candidatus Magnetobacterium bavaricum]
MQSLILIAYFSFLGGFTGGIGIDRFIGGNPLSSCRGFIKGCFVSCCFSSDILPPNQNNNY